MLHLSSKMLRSGWSGSPKIICLHSNPWNLWMWLYLKSVFADVVKNLEVWLSWLIWVGLKFNDKCPYKGHTEERHTTIREGSFFLLMSLLLFQDPVQDTTLHQLSCLHGLLWSVTVSQAFLGFQVLDGLGWYWPDILQNSPTLVCLLFFSWLDWAMVLGKNITEVQGPSHHIIKGVCTDMTEPWVFQVFPFKVTVFLFHTPYFGSKF